MNVEIFSGGLKPILKSETLIMYNTVLRFFSRKLLKISKNVLYKSFMGKTPLFTYINRIVKKKFFLYFCQTICLKNYIFLILLL